MEAPLSLFEGFISRVFLTPSREGPCHVSYALFEFHPLLLDILSVSEPPRTSHYTHGHILVSPSYDQHIPYHRS